VIALLLCAVIAVQGPGALQPGTGIVTGVLKTSDGHAAAGVRVGAVDVDDATGSSLLSVTETDSGGRYRLINIPAGRYYIVAGRLSDLHYYPQGGERSTASEIHVEAARIRADVNFTVPLGSQRPPPVLRGVGGNRSGPLSSPEDIAFQKIGTESNIDRKTQLLLQFEKDFPRSTRLAEAYVSLMNIYAGKNDAHRTNEYAEKAIRKDPENVNTLIQVSRMYALFQNDMQKAFQHAEKAVTLTKGFNAQSPPQNVDRVAWQKWTASMTASAQSNLAWVKQMEAWHRDALFSLVAPRRTR
jgi:tetratricopeptide (TPR) repeat protein